MQRNNLFSEEELKELGERTLDLLLSSIQNGDTAAACKLSQRMYNEFQGIHDLYRDWLTDLLTFIGRRFGDEVLYESLEKTVDPFTQRLAKFYEGKDSKKRFSMFAAGLRGHLQPFLIEEDDEKFTLTIACGSGGRQVTEGKYDSPNGFLRINPPQPMTFGQQDFPVYCAHCFFQNSALIEGKPIVVIEPSDSPGQKPCHYYIYKK